MFTGIVQGKVKIISIYKQKRSCIHVVDFPENLISNLETGASISYNGCCLTVIKIENSYISFELVEETLRTTNLDELKPTDTVNVERAIKFGDEINGHLMSGHIISTAKIEEIKISDNNYQMWISLKDSFLLKYIFYKGFIGIDGISLTVGEITSQKFCVYLIPETLKRTSLGEKKIGQNVNIEVDFQTQTIVDTVEKTLKSKYFQLTNNF